MVIVRTPRCDREVENRSTGPTKAVATQTSFESALRDRNIPVVEGETKTRTVLDYLARARADLSGAIH